MSSSNNDSFETRFESFTIDSDLDKISTKFGDASTCPYKLKWAFGFNSSVPVINLSTEKRSLVAYACSHLTVLYDYKSREIFTLQGHRNYVRTLSVDQTGKWLLTADHDDDSTVVIWDIKSRLPICTLFNPHGENGITAASMSPNAKYIVTVGNESVQVLKLWLWTFGRKNPDAEIELTEISDERVKDISFSSDDNHIFALTTDRKVVFVTWVSCDKKIEVHYPQILKKVNYLGFLNNTTFAAGTTKAFTGNTNGCIIVWDVDFEKLPQVDKKMEYVKSAPLQKGNITRIVSYNGMVITGNSHGDINFYDSDLKILYWIRECGLDAVYSISFDFQNAPECLSNIKGENDSEYIMTNSSKSKSDSTPNFEELVDKEHDEIPSNLTFKIEYPPKARRYSKSEDSRVLKYKTKFEKFQLPRDATLDNNVFCIEKFVVATLAGKVAWLDATSMKCRLLSNYFDAPLTAIDTHPASDYMVIGNESGTLFLFNYMSRRMMVKNNVPTVPDLFPILKSEGVDGKITHVSNTGHNIESNNYATALKYSPAAEMLASGLANGMLWILHPDTLEPLDPIPFKHSNAAIQEIHFSQCTNYIAYYDDAMTVLVLKRNLHFHEATAHYDFLGKYRAHTSPINTLSFGCPLKEGKLVPRLLSLGGDKDLVEYDLIKSGPYPEPGLVILQIDRIELTETPLCMSWYPAFEGETFLAVSNSDYKLKLIDAVKKNNRATFLGPTFSSPVKKMMISQIEQTDTSGYMIFATDKEIGLHLLPIDGNPCKIVGMIGHPEKISCMRISTCGRILFTIGKGDQCALMWSIKFRSVDAMHRLGGTGLSPFFGLINGGKEGWLFNEMQDLFIYAQILQQGELCTGERIIGDDVDVNQLPNLMRAVGFYPTKYQLENLMNEVIYKNYTSTGDVVKKINFDEFVKLYINHRPTFGISNQELENAFSLLSKQEIIDEEDYKDNICSTVQSSDVTPDYRDNICMSRDFFIDILCGQIDDSTNTTKPYDEAMTEDDAQTYLRHLLLRNSTEQPISEDEESCENIFELLPYRISYKDFATNIMGIESSKETRADNYEE